jgi:hypothetical protein
MSPGVIICVSHIVITHIRSAITASRHRAPVRPPEEPPVAIILIDPEAALVHQRVVLAAEQHQVGETRFTARRPVLDVVRIDEASASAAGEAAPLVACPERPFDGFRHDTGLAPDAQRLVMPVLDQHDAVRIAADAPHRFDGQAGPPHPSAEGRLVHVHDDLVVVRRTARSLALFVPVAIPTKICLRQFNQCIRSLRRPALVGKFRSRRCRRFHGPVQCLVDELARLERQLHGDRDRSARGIPPQA